MCLHSDGVVRARTEPSVKYSVDVLRMRRPQEFSMVVASIDHDHKNWCFRLLHVRLLQGLLTPGVGFILSFHTGNMVGEH